MAYDTDDHEAAAAHRYRNAGILNGICGVRTGSESEADYQYGRMLVIANGGADPEDKGNIFSRNTAPQSGGGDGASGLAALFLLWVAYEAAVSAWNYVTNAISFAWHDLFYVFAGGNIYFLALCAILAAAGVVGGVYLIRYLLRLLVGGLRRLAMVCFRAVFRAKTPPIDSSFDGGDSAYIGPLPAEEARRLIREDARQRRRKREIL